MTTRHVFFLLALLLCVACGKSTDDASQFIANDTPSVMAFNVAQILQKADFEAFKSSEIYKDAVAEWSEKDKLWLEVINNPKASGLDFSKNIYVSGGLGTEIRPDRATFLFSLSDAALFEALVQKVYQKSPRTEGGARVVSDDNAESPGVTVAWKDKVAVVSAQPSAVVLGLFGLKKEATLAELPDFKALMSEKHDIYMFTRLEKMAGPAADFLGGSVKDNFMVASADFEAGRVVANGIFKLNDKLKQEYAIAFKDNVGTDFSKYVSADKLTAAMTLALNTKGLKEIINTNAELKVLFEVQNSELFNASDALKAFEGDMFAAYYDLNQPNMDVLMGLKIADKVLLNQLLDRLVAEQVLKKTGEGQYASRLPADLSVLQCRIVDDILFVGELSHLQPNSNGNEAFRQILNKNIMGAFVDMRQWPAADVNQVLTQMQLSVKNGRFNAILNGNKADENLLKTIWQSANAQHIKTKNGQNQKESL